MHRPGHRRTAGNANLEARKIGLRQIGMVEHRLEHRRHAGKAGAAVFLDRCQHLACLEPRHHRDRRAGHHRVIEQRGVGEDVEERQRAHEDFAAGIAEGVDRGDLLGIHRELVVPQHGPLGPPGGAAGVLQEGEIGGGDFDRSRRTSGRHFRPALDRRSISDIGDLTALQQLERQPFVPRQHVGEAADDQRFQIGRGQHLGGGLVEFGHIHRHQHAGARIAHLPRQLFDRIERREIHHHRARHHRPVIGGGVDRHIGQEQADTVTLGDPECLQPGREGSRVAVDVGVGVGAAKEMQERRLRIAAQRALEHRRQAHRREGGVERGRVVIGGVTDRHVSNLG